MIILKVVWRDQIRRVSYEPPTSGSFVALQLKLQEMLGLQNKPITIRCGDPSSQTIVTSDNDLYSMIEDVNKTSPWPILRVVVEENLDAEKLPLASNIAVQPLPEAKEQQHPQENIHCLGCVCCNVIIGSTYYKCLNCLSVELCEDCEEKNSHPGHLLVKLRCSVSNLPLKQQMVFTDHILDAKDRVAARNRKQALRESCEKEQAEKKAAQIKKRQQEKEARDERIKARELKKEQEQQRKQAREAKKKSKEQERKIKKRATKQILVPKKVAKQQQQQQQQQTLNVPESVSSNAEPVSAVLQAPSSVPNDAASLELLSEFHAIPVPEDESIPSSPEPTPVLALESPSVSELVSATVPSEESASEVPPPTEPSVTTPTTTTPPPPVADRKPNPFVQNLERLAEMGFTDKEKNIRLLVKHVGDLDATVEELLRTKSSWFW